MEMAGRWDDQLRDGAHISERSDPRHHTAARPASPVSADLLVILTAVSMVAIDFGKPTQRMPEPVLGQLGAVIT